MGGSVVAAWAGWERVYVKTTENTERAIVVGSVVIPMVRAGRIAAAAECVGSTQPFNAYLGEGNVGIRGMIDEFGMVDFTYMTGSGTPRGAVMFQEMLEHFGSNVKGIRGSWGPGGELSTNFDVYKAAIRRGLSAEDAAALTPTGKNATRAGFTKIKVFADDADEVVVEFSR